MNKMAILTIATVLALTLFFLPSHDKSAKASGSSVRLACDDIPPEDEQHFSVE